jgi:hypothetical protein
MVLQERIEAVPAPDAFKRRLGQWMRGSRKPFSALRMKSPESFVYGVRRNAF